MYQDEVRLNRMDPNDLQTRAEETDEQTTPKIPGLNETNKAKVSERTQRTQGSERKPEQNRRSNSVASFRNMPSV